MATNVYPYVRNYLSNGIDRETIEKFSSQTVTFDDVSDYRLPWEVRFHQILQLIKPALEIKDVKKKKGKEKKKKVVVVNTEGLLGDFIAIGYNAKLASTYTGKAEYYVILAGETEIQGKKFSPKYIVWSFIYAHPLADFAARLRFDIRGGVFPTPEEVEAKLSSYMIIRQKSSAFDGTYLLYPKPVVPTYIDNQLLLMKELFLAGKGDSYLELDNTYTVQRVEFVYMVNSCVASFLQRWMKKPTLANWCSIYSEIKWDL